MNSVTIKLLHCAYGCTAIVHKILLGNSKKWLTTLISYMLRQGKVFVKCYVVIGHILSTPSRLHGIAFKYSYSIHTVILLTKSSVLVLGKGKMLLTIDKHFILKIDKRN